MPFIMSPSTPSHPSTALQEASPAAVEPAPSPPRPQSISVPLPHIIHTTLHIQLTRYETSNMIFLTNTDPSSSPSTSPLGSFVYAMPNVCPLPLPRPTISSLQPRVYIHTYLHTPNPASVSAPPNPSVHTSIPSQEQSISQPESLRL